MYVLNNNKMLNRKETVKKMSLVILIKIKLGRFNYRIILYMNRTLDSGFVINFYLRWAWNTR